MTTQSYVQSCARSYAPSYAPAERWASKWVANKWIASGVIIFLGVAWMALLSQVKIALPWTPVPITGQTFGVAVMALMFGARLSFVSYAAYLTAGFVGLPVFAGLGSGLMWGPTMGYLVGMLLASVVMGRLADKGWGRSFGKALLACYMGSFITFAAGLFVLSFFVPQQALLIAGLLPFLPGDLIKNLTAAALVSRMTRE